MQSIFANLERFLPKAREELLKELRQFPDGMTYYGSVDDPEPLQGDIWRDVECHGYTEGVFRVAPRTVMIVSNSCDLTSANKKNVPATVSYAPLVGLQKFAGIISEITKDAGKVSNLIEAIKNQEVTQFFYAPRGAKLDEDSVVFLSAVQSIPLADFNNLRTRSRLAILTTQAHWVFLTKLALHFCRTDEAVPRQVVPTAT